MLGLLVPVALVALDKVLRVSVACEHLRVMVSVHAIKRMSPINLAISIGSLSALFHS